MADFCINCILLQSWSCRTFLKVSKKLVQILLTDKDEGSIASSFPHFTFARLISAFFLVSVLVILLMMADKPLFLLVGVVLALDDFLDVLLGVA